MSAEKKSASGLLQDKKVLAAIAAIVVVAAAAFYFMGGGGGNTTRAMAPFNPQNAAWETVTPDGFKIFADFPQQPGKIKRPIRGTPFGTIYNDTFYRNYKEVQFRLTRSMLSHITVRNQSSEDIINEYIRWYINREYRGQRNISYETETLRTLNYMLVKRVIAKLGDRTVFEGLFFLSDGKNQMYALITKFSGNDQYAEARQKFLNSSGAAMPTDSGDEGQDGDEDAAE